MNGLFSELLDAILDAGTIMSESELVEWAQRPRRRKGLSPKIYHID